MTPEEREAIERRATMEAQIKHMSEAIDTVKRTLDRLSETLVSRAQHEELKREFAELRTDLADHKKHVDEKLKEQSPTGVIEKVTKWATGVTALASVAALAWLLFDKINGRA